MTTPDIQAIDIPDPEKAVILDLFGSVEAFADWQRQVLADEIELRASQRGSVKAQAVVAQEVDDVKALIPTLFPDAAAES